ncbi:MAG: T9SS type A sorting domain-containing protein [Bacteroidetes bacterium]|nr:T9SS type A sorting domain-containing protein [Bacteroidota bacterium]
MNRRYALWGSSAKLGVILLFAALTGIGSQWAHAQADKPELPTLTLTGQGAGWNQTYYPDGRIWAPRSGDNGVREILVPVFVKNCWRTTTTYKAFPIYSFKMKVQFDSTAVEFVGIDKNGPLRGNQAMPLNCLAKDFEFSTSVARDTSYQNVINGPIQNRLRGKRVMITAVSPKALPQTGNSTDACDQRPFVEMFYMRFRVLANPASNPVSARTPLIITNDTLFYNDFQVGKELTFPNDPTPGRYAGLGGVDNYYIDANQQEQVRDPLRPSRYGMIWLEVTDEIPRFTFTNVSDRRFRIADSVDNSNNQQWFIVDPITLDSGSTYDDAVNGIGTRDVDVINATAGSRMTEIFVQSDSKWLKFKSFTKGGTGEVNPFPNPVRQGFIQYLDKGILGTTNGTDPLGNPTTLQRDLNMRVICDPNELPLGEGGEVAGIYVGYLTFSSYSADVSPVRMKVTFIYFRPPFEPSQFDEANQWQAGPSGPTRGIRLELRNSNNPIERTNIIFGVGARARDSVDTLFGETVYQGALNGFGARWYPQTKDGNDIYQFGLGDLWAASTSRPKFASRDIRNIYSDTTLVYICRFNAGSALNYPIVVSWDTDDFPAGSDLFIRDILNGERFNVNMRQATSLGGTKYSFTIRDADITAFAIEYTLPKVVSFPVINKGWNLLSVPVNPSSAFYKDVFKKALNIPVFFSQNTYQQNQTVKPGIGYFMKYAEEVDKTIAGVRLTRIDEDTYKTELYEGWNTIGSLSTPINTEAIGLTVIGTADAQILGDIYRYNTNRGYEAITELVPGRGHWMKISGHAYLKMSARSNGKTGINMAAARNSVLANATQVSINDVSGKSTDLYLAERTKVEARDMFELPPVAPHNLFDVRFNTNMYVEDAVSPVINLQGVSFPMSVTMNYPDRNYTVVNAVTGSILGSIKAGVTNTIKIDNSNTPAIRLMAEEVGTNALTVAVAPNPVAQTAAVNYTVVNNGRVTLGLYNAVGELVATIVDTDMTMGIYSADLNAAALPAGRYIVKLNNGGNVFTSSVTIVR